LDGGRRLSSALHAPQLQIEAGAGRVLGCPKTPWRRQDTHICLASCVILLGRPRSSLWPLLLPDSQDVGVEGGPSQGEGPLAPRSLSLPGPCPLLSGKLQNLPAPSLPPCIMSVLKGMEALILI
jgi:hypothetical protein